VGILCVAAFVLLTTIAACADAVPAPDGGGTSTESNAVMPSGSESYRDVTFTTEDGVALSGHLFGSGEAGIVLAHMYPADQTSWHGPAERLAREGYLVLTFDFRGYGDSQGSKDIELIDRDVFAAIIALADAGAGRVLLVGASMGGTACLVAADASQPLSRVFVSGVATLSAPVEFKGLSAQTAVPKLTMPLLFVAAEKDAGADGARRLQELSGDTGDLHIVPGDDHGTDLLQGDQAGEVWGLLLSFVHENLPLSSR
jgi:pimeloyl-ACP methyl ester carboxylesterase